MKNNNPKGSALILVLIGVMVLSLLGIFGLTHTSTEITLTRNFGFDKQAFFLAETGINVGTNHLRNTIDFMSVNVTGDGAIEMTGYTDTYKTGHMSDTAPQDVEGFAEFRPPRPPGMSVAMGGPGINVAGWHLVISSEITKKNRVEARKEIHTVIVTLVPD